MKDDPSFAFNFYTVRASPAYFRVCVFWEWRVFHLFPQYNKDSMVNSIEFRILLEHHFLGDLGV